MIRNIIKILRPIIFPFVQLYWFVFRPHTRGTKIILTHKDEILFVKHTYGRKYSFPGGGIGKVEDPEIGIKREVKEELGLDIENVKYLESFVDTGEYKRDEIFVFTAELPNRSINVNSLEIDKVEWHSFENLPSMGRVAVRILNSYIKHKLIN